VGPETRYAMSGDVHITYQVTDERARSISSSSGYVTHMELQ